MNSEKRKTKRYKKSVVGYVDPILKDIFDKYCKINNTNCAEVIRIALTEYLLKSELITNEDKTRIINIDIIDFNRAMFNHYPSGLDNNPEIQKRIIDISNFEL